MAQYLSWHKQVLLVLKTELLNISISYKKLYNLCFSHAYFGQISLEFSFRRT